MSNGNIDVNINLWMLNENIAANSFKNVPVTYNLTNSSGERLFSKIEVNQK